MNSEVCFGCWRRPCKCTIPKTAADRLREQEDRGAKAARWMFNVAKKKGRWGLSPKIDYKKISDEELGWVIVSVLRQIEENCRISDCHP